MKPKTISVPVEWLEGLIKTAEDVTPMDTDYKIHYLLGYISSARTLLKNKSDN